MALDKIEWQKRRHVIDWPWNFGTKVWLLYLLQIEVEASPIRLISRKPMRCVGIYKYYIMGCNI